MPLTTLITRLPLGSKPKVVLEAMRGERLYATAALIIAGIVIVGGLVMIFLNIGGQVDVTVNLSGHESKLNTAVVGIPVIFAGVVVIVWTRPKVIVAGPDDKGGSEETPDDDSAERHGAGASTTTSKDAAT